MYDTVRYNSYKSTGFVDRLKIESESRGTGNMGAFSVRVGYFSDISMKINCAASGKYWQL